jgi:hypothetical protein
VASSPHLDAGGHAAKLAQSEATFARNAAKQAANTLTLHVERDARPI